MGEANPVERISKTHLGVARLWARTGPTSEGVPFATEVHAAITSAPEGAQAN